MFRYVAEEQDVLSTTGVLMIILRLKDHLKRLNSSDLLIKIIVLQLITNDLLLLKLNK